MTIAHCTQDPTHTQAFADAAAQQLEDDMAQIAREEMGVQESEAHAIAQAMVRGLRKRFGGMRMGARGAAIYVPAPSKVERNEAIRKEFNGTNRQQIQAKYGIKRAQLYRIVAERTGAARIGISGPKVPVFDGT